MTYFTIFLIFISGLSIGSFLNCLIRRLHKKDTILGRSYCPVCRHQLAWYDNLPIASFLFLKGKCRYCSKKISWQYPSVELITGLLFVLSYYINFKDISIINYPLSVMQMIRDWFLICVMMIIFIYDMRWYLILDVVTLPSALIILVLNLVIDAVRTGGIGLWQNILFSGIIGGGFFLFQFTVSKGRWIGGGDIRLGLLMGLALGWPNILVAIFLAYIIGSIIGVGLIAGGKKQWGSQIPFGIFLSSATIISLFWGGAILDWYLSILY